VTGHAKGSNGLEDGQRSLGSSVFDGCIAPAGGESEKIIMGTIMGTTLVREQVGSDLGRGGDERERELRLAELVSLLSDCPLRRAAALVERSTADDPLTRLAESLCGVLPRRAAPTGARTRRSPERPSAVDLRLV
jgi:hypothetical protein